MTIHKRREDSYQWFAGPQAMQIAECLRKSTQRLGADDFALCVIEGVDEEGRKSVVLEVIDRKSNVLGSFNASFPCPPICWPPD